MDFQQPRQLGVGQVQELADSVETIPVHGVHLRKAAERSPGRLPLSSRQRHSGGSGAARFGRDAVAFCPTSFRGRPRLRGAVTVAVACVAPPGGWGASRFRFAPKLTQPCTAPAGPLRAEPLPPTAARCAGPRRKVLRFSTRSTRPGERPVRQTELGGARIGMASGRWRLHATPCPCALPRPAHRPRTHQTPRRRAPSPPN